MRTKNIIEVRDRKPFYTTTYGGAYLADSMEVLRSLKPNTVSLVMTSPPFPLVFEKEYGNVRPEAYIEWLLGYAKEIQRVLRDDGSFVLDVGGAWDRGRPTKSLYQYELLVALCRRVGFFLAQDFFWYRPATLPAPAEWVTVRRVRVKDAVNHVFWLSKTESPKADNRRVLQPYSPDMLRLLKRGYRAKERPSGHNITHKFGKDHGGSIPSNVFKFPVPNGNGCEVDNLIEMGNNDSNGSYLKACRDAGLKPHPARFPAGLPEFFIKMLTDEGDIVLDPFAGSNVTGAAAEKFSRRWIAIELREDYLLASRFRFQQPQLKLVD
ncbi:MAG TPA: site-specific DNA-methyltransferase [Elusimicrobia bacterium]|nr:site-specific DNA-methyltransferase [Elusimicrobiota bacterium]